MNTLEFDQTPIYILFLKKTFLWCLVSGIYKPITFLTRHHQTLQNKNQYQLIKNQTLQKPNLWFFTLILCLVVSGYD
jgi:hypothetical protein